MKNILKTRERVLDDFMEKNLAPEIRDENEEEIEVYKEVANLADELRLTVLELEKEGKIERNVLMAKKSKDQNAAVSDAEIVLEKILALPENVEIFE